MKQLLAPGGCILLDSSDLKYLYEDEDGSYVLDLAADYYGEIDFQMQYKQVKGDSFDWLYVDFDTLSAYVSQYGFHAQIIKEAQSLRLSGETLVVRITLKKQRHVFYVLMPLFFYNTPKCFSAFIMPSSSTEVVT